MSVLDLCCGKGGDVPKWKFVRPSHYVGADLSGTSVKEAQRRYGEIILDKVRPVEAPPAIFIVADCGDEKNLISTILETEPGLKSLRKKIMFDIVSCQFSVHYMFEHESKLRAFFRNVTDRLEPGGVFIGTTIDSDRVVHKIR
jgi:mRNA (guanine-N7-)-methyltransferase